MDRKFKIGDKVLTCGAGDIDDGTAGTVVEYGEQDGELDYLVHIPGFDGHNGDNDKYPTAEYWYVSESDLVPVHTELMGAPTHTAPVLPTDAESRKNIPIGSGVLDYFPAALIEIAKVSKAGNDQHNPGQPLHWARGKSTDHSDTIIRHWMERGSLDTDGQRHSAKLAWRALALLQEELEAAGAPKARGAK